MKRIFLLLTLLCAVSFLLTSCGDTATNANKPANAVGNAPANTATNTATTSTANADAEVKKLIADLAAALPKNDVAALDKIYADDYTLVTQTGEVTTKAARIEAIKTGDLKFENVAFNDVKVRPYGDTAVAIANSKGRSTFKGKTSDTNYRITFVANKTKDGWRLVSAQLTSLTEAPASTDANKKDESNKNTNTGATNSNK